MKSTEFSAINEGLLSDIGQNLKSAPARWGMLGKTRQISANKDRQSDMAYKTGLSSFSKALSDALTRAYSIGAIGQTQTQTIPTATTAKTTQSSKLTPQQTAALKDRLKAGTGATSGKSGFKDYVGGSGERMTGVDSSKAPIFKKIQRESYAEFDSLLEGIININEAQGISDFVSDFVMGQAQKDRFVIPQQFQQPLKTLSDALETDFIKNGGKKIDQTIIRKLWDLYYTASQYAGNQQTQQTQQTQQPSNSPEASEQRDKWKEDLIKKLTLVDINNPAAMAQLKIIEKELAEYIKKAEKVSK